MQEEREIQKEQYSFEKCLLTEFKVGLSRKILSPITRHNYEHHKVHTS